MGQQNEQSAHTQIGLEAIGNLVRTNLQHGGFLVAEFRGSDGHPHGEEAKANATLFAASHDLLADLREAATTLRRYEALHRAKGTDDSTAKAEVNAALAARFETTITRATGSAS